MLGKVSGVQVVRDSEVDAKAGQSVVLEFHGEDADAVRTNVVAAGHQPVLSSETIHAIRLHDLEHGGVDARLEDELVTTALKTAESLKRRYRYTCLVGATSLLLAYSVGEVMPVSKRHLRVRRAVDAHSAVLNDGAASALHTAVVRHRPLVGRGRSAQAALAKPLVVVVLTQHLKRAAYQRQYDLDPTRIA